MMAYDADQVQREIERDAAEEVRVEAVEDAAVARDERAGVLHRRFQRAAELLAAAAFAANEDDLFGRGFRAAERSGRMPRQPPVGREIIPSLAPKVEADGNGVGGVPSVVTTATARRWIAWAWSAPGIRTPLA